MQWSAPAKINLNLRITGKRADGYHSLQSLVVFTQLADSLHIAPAPSLSLEVNGVFAEAAGVDDNLVLKAARLLDGGAGHGAHLTLTKNIPVGAGLGGGSADAAVALKALNQFWQLGYSNESLLQLAGVLGSDVSACLIAQSCWMGGAGNLLTPVSHTPACHVVLVYPHRVLGAKEVYAALSPPYSDAITMPPLQTKAEWLAYLTYEANDLAPAAIGLCPEIEHIVSHLAMLEGALFARMSGSGSCCFAVFADEDAASAALAKLQQEWPDYWIARTALRT